MTKVRRPAKPLSVAAARGRRNRWCADGQLSYCYPENPRITRDRRQMRPSGTTHSRVLAAVLLGCASPGLAVAQDLRFEAAPHAEGRWLRGNTHAHTTESDGDSPPGVVARWYREHGYDFLVLSDHNVFTDPRTLGAVVDSTFLLIPGEELTSTFGDAAVHVNGLNIPHVVEPRIHDTLLGTVQANVDAVREVHGVPHINHPNFRWSFGYEVLRQVRNDRLLEIFNGHPYVHNDGAGGEPGMEEIWDMLLTDGVRMYGIAVDDAHHFLEFGHEQANPGRGWVAVRASALEAGAILEAMEAGRFYASTGVELEAVDVTASRIEIRISQRGDFRYTTQFIGSGGRVMKEMHGATAYFDLHAHGPVAREGETPYVRARVTDSGGAVAWVQPVFLTGG
jgi:hypothetical protein